MSTFQKHLKAEVLYVKSTQLLNVLIKRERNTTNLGRDIVVYKVCLVLVSSQCTLTRYRYLVVPLVADFKGTRIIYQLTFQNNLSICFVFRS